MNAVDGEEAKAGKRAGNYGVCKGYFLKQLPTPQKSNYLSANYLSAEDCKKFASQTGRASSVLDAGIPVPQNRADECRVLFFLIAHMLIYLIQIFFYVR